jgi:hypothetical protein
MVRLLRCVLGSVKTSPPPRVDQRQRAHHGEVPPAEPRGPTGPPGADCYPHLRDRCDHS